MSIFSRFANHERLRFRWNYLVQMTMIVGHVVTEHASPIANYLGEKHATVACRPQADGEKRKGLS